MEELTLEKKEIKNLIIAWIAIGIVIFIFIITRLFYTVETQHISVSPYSFTGVYKSDGVHYTAKPSTDKYFDPQGEEVVIKGHTLSFDGHQYEFSRGISSYMQSSQQPAVDMITFSNNAHRNVIRMSGSYMEFSATSYLPSIIDNNNKTVLFYNSVIAHENFMKHYSNPEKFNFGIFLLSLFLLAIGTIGVCCPSVVLFLEKIRIRNLCTFPEDCDIQPNKTLMEYEWFGNIFCCLLGLAILAWSFYCHL